MPALAWLLTRCGSTVALECLASERAHAVTRQRACAIFGRTPPPPALPPLALAGCAAAALLCSLLWLFSR